MKEKDILTLFPSLLILMVAITLVIVSWNNLQESRARLDALQADGVTRCPGTFQPADPYSDPHTWKGCETKIEGKWVKN